MNEVSVQAAAMLLDSIEQHGFDPTEVWAGLPVSTALLKRPRARIDWETWVAMLVRVDEQSAPPLEKMFVSGAGARQGHPFVQIANAILSLRELYRLFARWGIRREFVVARATFTMHDARHGRFVLTIDPDREGSPEMLRFVVGLLEDLPRLQGYAPSRVRVHSISSHRGEYDVELPEQRTLVGRAARLVRVVSGLNATVDELEAQATEIATKRQELEAQLAETKKREEWLEVALASSNIGLWRWDPRVRRTRLSPPLAQWLGVPGETEIDTTVWAKAVHPDDQSAIAKAMTTALATLEPFDFEYRVVLHDEVRWYSSKGRVARDKDGHLYAYGSTVDVTEKKLMDSRLRLADRMIAAGTLAAGVAHEINNPLTYVIGSVDLMQRRLAAHPAAYEATEELVAQVLDGCERIRSVVADVRAFARHDDNSIGPLALNEACKAATRIVSADVSRRATLVLELSPDEPRVLANTSRLGQVVINLIINASHAMPAKRAVADNRIVIRTRQLATGEATIVVEDNGSGIAPDVLPRVFDPFFTTKPVGVGTGLGLSVCQGIVTSLGGRIDVTSDVGRGSTFTVTLDAVPATDATATAGAPTQPTPSRVLVIDDEPMIRTVVARTLTAQGFSVDEATSGRDGLARAVGDSYDVILCDLMMPDLDGVSLHGELLAKRPELAPRIVFISGGAVTPRTQAFLQTPGVVVLHKPFAFERLVEAIERAAATPS